LFTIEDILFDMNIHQNILDASFVQTLKSKNEYGESLFYGIRHDTIRSLVIIYPKSVALFIQSMSASETKTGGSERFMDVQHKKKESKAQERYTTLSETMCKDFALEAEVTGMHNNLFGFDEDPHKKQHSQPTVSLEWDDSVISNMQKMSMMNNHRIDTLKIVPIIFYKNFTH